MGGTAKYASLLQRRLQDTSGPPRRDTEGLPSARRDLGGLLLQLQRSHGNQFVQRLVAGPAAPVAPLVVGAAHDPAEAAADRIAGAGSLIHRRAAAGDPGGALDGETSRAVGAAQRAGGAPLGAMARARMEAALGTRLPGVRVHADARARDLCDTVRAHAFTIGQHVFFRRGLPDLGSAAGRHLLAHELAHVTQQSSPAVIRRTYLDGAENWFEKTTRTQRVTGLVKPRSTELRRIDDAVVRVRAAYAEGVLPRLSRALQALRDRIAEWRRTRRARMRATEVNALDAEAEAFKDRVDRWRGIAFTAARDAHRQQLNRVEGWLDEGSRSEDVRLRNSVDWVRRGKSKLFVVTETPDREYRARFFLRGSKPTDRDATFFPKPNRAGRGAVGDQAADSHLYDPVNAADRKNVVLDKRINGWNKPGYIAVTDAVTSDDRHSALFFQTLRHEVQHGADRHRGPALSSGIAAAVIPEAVEFQKALREYKTEYRAYSYQGGAALTVRADADRRGKQWAPGQFEVFERIRKDYAAVETAVGGDAPTQEQSRFVSAAHAYRNPDTEGFNKYNSARIDDLYLALSAVKPNTVDPTDPAVVEALRAARALNSSDVAYIRAGSEEVGGRVEAYMLRAMIRHRLDGPAFDAFVVAIRQTRVFGPPRVARRRNQRRPRLPAFRRPGQPT